MPSTGAKESLNSTTLRWRHNGYDGVSNPQPHHCLLNRLFGCRSKKTAKLRVTGLCAGNSPGTGEFPAQMTSNAENVSIWWRHHEGCHILFEVIYVGGQGKHGLEPQLQLRWLACGQIFIVVLKLMNVPSCKTWLYITYIMYVYLWAKNIIYR